LGSRITIKPKHFVSSPLCKPADLPGLRLADTCRDLLLLQQGTKPPWFSPKTTLARCCAAKAGAWAARGSACSHRASIGPWALYLTARNGAKVHPEFQQLLRLPAWLGGRQEPALHPSMARPQDCLGVRVQFFLFYNCCF